MMTHVASALFALLISAAFAGQAAFAEELRVLGEVREGKILLRRARWFATEEEAKTYLAKQPAVRATNGSTFQVQPAFKIADAPIYEEEQKYFAAPLPWKSYVYEEVPLVPKGHEKHFDPTNDHRFLQLAWQYVATVVGYPDDDGVVRQVQRFYMDDRVIQRLRSTYDFSKPVRLSPAETGFSTDVELFPDTLKRKSGSSAWSFLYRGVDTVASAADQIKRDYELAKKYFPVDEEHFKLGGFRYVTNHEALPIQITRRLEGDRSFLLRVRFAVGEIALHVRGDSKTGWDLLSGDAMMGTGEATIATKHGSVLGMGSRAIWPTGEHLLDFSGTKEMFAAITEKYPSRLDAKYQFDRRGWAARHVEYSFGELAKLAEKEPVSDPASAMMLDDYQDYVYLHILGWYDIPIVVTGYRPFSRGERKSHLAALEVYFKEHKSKMTPANTLQRPRVLQCQGRSSSYGKFVKQFGRPPNLNELQWMYENQRTHFGEPRRSARFDSQASLPPKLSVPTFPRTTRCRNSLRLSDHDPFRFLTGQRSVRNVPDIARKEISSLLPPLPLSSCREARFQGGYSCRKKKSK